jgi:hypothetical protein
MTHTETSNPRSLGLLLVLVAAFWFNAPNSLGQKPVKPEENPPGPSASGNSKLEKELALSLIRQLPQEIKSESDKPAAARIQAQAADALWSFDELEARAVFRLAFDTARAPLPEVSALDQEAKARQLTVSRRQAAALQEVIALFAKHDQLAAERWLDLIRDQQKTEEPGATQISQERAEFLAQLASQLAKTNPEEAQKLGLLSLGAKEVPRAFIRLLFALENIDPAKSTSLFQAAIAAMRRNGSSGKSTLGLLSNYLFLNNGFLFRQTDVANARLFVEYVLAAAAIEVGLVRQALSNKGSMPDSSVSLTNFLALRGLAIVRANAPDKLAFLQPIFNELSSDLNQQQRDDLALMSVGMRQQDALDTADQGDLDAQIQRAEREKDSVVRDHLWRSLAIQIMRGDSERASSIAARIDDQALREQTQDDINLVVAGETVRGATYEVARKIALRFNDTNLRAKTLAELADRAWLRAKNREKANELLSEAYEMASKGEFTADRAAITLLLAQKFAKFDLERGFSLLEAAIKIINQIQITATAPAALKLGPRIRVISITVVGGVELTTGYHATLDSLNFQELAELVRTDYFRSRNLGDSIHNRIVRARYLGQSVLNLARPPRELSLEQLIP